MSVNFFTFTGVMGTGSFHNKMALTYRPNDQEILNNLALLEELIENQTSRAYGVTDTIVATGSFGSPPL